MTSNCILTLYMCFRTHGGLIGPNRHAGDLGNIQTDSSGRMLFDLFVEAPRHGPMHDFIGLTLVIHSGQDDLGVNPDQGSKTTGNSGSRLACATIGFRYRPYWSPPSHSFHQHFNLFLNRNFQFVITVPAKYTPVHFTSSHVLSMFTSIYTDRMIIRYFFYYVF